MKTRDFIQNLLEMGLYSHKQNGWCSSVFYEKNVAGFDHCFYSYGGHYPLLMTKGSHAFLNDRGWSNTTAKHISWAWQAAQAAGYEVHHYNASYIGKPSPIRSGKVRRDGHGVYESITAELSMIGPKLGTLRKNAHRKRDWLANRIVDLSQGLKAFESLFYYSPNA